MFTGLTDGGAIQFQWHTISLHLVKHAYYAGVLIDWKNKDDTEEKLPAPAGPPAPADCCFCFAEQELPQYLGQGLTSLECQEMCS